jgi:hypothetical protein
MKRQLVSLCCALLLGSLCSLDAGAAELPLRKPGLWEMKMVRAGSSLPEMTMQHCTDETTDKDMSTSFSSMGKKDLCAKRDIEQTATGYAIDSACTVAGASMTSHSEVTGDFNSAYTVKTTSHTERGPAGLHDATMTVEAKWLGACKPDQKPGDIVMPGGFKLNVKDAEKLKNLVPK